MENTTQEPTPIPEPIPTNATEHPDGGLFSWIGKIFLFTFLSLILIVGGYFIGKQTPSSAEPTPTALPSPTTLPTHILPSPTPVSQKTKAISGGLADSEAFNSYTINVPGGWTDARETTITAGIDKLTLTKDGYSVTIYQAPMGGGACLYPGDTPSEMAQTFDNFADINEKSGKLRRSWNKKDDAQTISYTICQKADDASYGSITKFGAISVVSPNPATAAMLVEIDGILASVITQ